jgi:hypothetical protein
LPDETITLDDIAAEMSPEGRLHLENAQLRLALKRTTAQLAELTNEAAPTVGPAEKRAVAARAAQSNGAAQ